MPDGLSEQPTTPPVGLLLSHKARRGAPRGATILPMADLNQIAYRIVRESTEPKEPETPTQTNGRNGGLKGGKAVR